MAFLPLSEKNRRKMLYDAILARSFSKHEQKKFKYGALIGFFVIASSFCTVMKPYLAPLPAACKYFLLYILIK